MKTIIESIKNMNVTTKLTAVAGIVGIVTIGTVLILNMQPTNPNITLLKEEFVVEYGTPVSAIPKDYIDAEDKVLEETKIVVSKVRHEENKDYEKVGTYQATATYKNEELTFKIVVKDTTKPVFKDFKEKVEVPREYTGDLVKEFTAEDLSEVTITVDTKEVDFSKAGEYKANVTATDKYKNKATKEFTVVVGEKSQAEIDEEKAKAEEEAKQEQIQQQQVQQNQQNVNTGGNTQTGGITGDGDTGGGSTGGGSTCSFTGWQMVSNSGYANYDYNTAYTWGEENCPAHQYYKILSTKDNCGNTGWTIQFKNKE